MQAPSPPHCVQAAANPVLQSPAVPADAVEHVAAPVAADPRRARLEAPRVCQLCGRGFVDWPSLLGPCNLAHHSFVEYRKRLFYEAEKLDALPLEHQRKRTMLANFVLAGSP